MPQLSLLVGAPGRRLAGAARCMRRARLFFATLVDELKPTWWSLLMMTYTSNALRALSKLIIQVLFPHDEYFYADQGPGRVAIASRLTRARDAPPEIRQPAHTTYKSRKRTERART